VGIPVLLAKEEILSTYKYFGQYGPIKKVVVNASHVHSCPNQAPSVSAYVTFRNIDDALECIYSLESFSLEGNQLKASFGTTKYCSCFLRGQKCNNPDCMYLHHSGDPTDSFSKDEITGSCSRFVDMTRPSRPADYNDFLKQDSRPTVLPPRRILKKPIVRRVSPDEGPAEEDEPIPAILDDGPGVSLAVQLGLGRPSVRDVFYTLLMTTGTE
jgi:RNA recognition motif-containing protein